MAKPLILVPPPNNPTWPEVYIYQELAQLADGKTVIDAGLPIAHTTDPEYSYDAIQQLTHQVLRELHRLPEPSVILWCEAFTGLPTLVKSVEPLIGWKDVAHVGLVHGGSFIPGDTMAWPRITESRMFYQYDRLIAPTMYHGVLQARDYPSLSIEICKWPLLGDVFAAPTMPWAERPQHIVFPHRQIPEKGIGLFRALDDALDGMGSWLFIETSKKYSRPQYLELLGTCKAVFADPVMETYGVALEEAMALGCCPVIGRHPVYEELYGELELPPHWHDGTLAGATDALREVDTCPGYHLPIDRFVSYERSVSILRTAMR